MVYKKPTKSTQKTVRTKMVKPLKSVRPAKKTMKVETKAIKNTKVSTKTKTAEKLKSPKKLSLREKKIQDIKKNLLKQKEALLAEAWAALNSLPGQTIFPDLSDQASAETDRSFMLKLRGREQKLLKKIEEAIDRIENGTFGICDACGQEIDIRRLEARPVTTMCIECKTQQEEEEKLRET